MLEFVTLSCPSCGGKLEISKDINRFACAHCGNEHVVNRRGGLISLSPIEEEIRSIQKNTDKTASELAIKRLSDELISLENKYDNLMLKFQGGNDAAVGFYASYAELRKLSRITTLFSSGEHVEKTIRDLSLEEIETVIAHIGKEKGSADWKKRKVSYGNRIISLRTEIERKRALLEKNRKNVDAAA